MITEHARQSLDRIFQKAAKSRLIVDAADTCDIRQLTDGDLPAVREKSMVVLTISSIQFRLLVILHVDETPAIGSYFCRNAPDKSFDEIFFEIANLCCGAINQDMQRYFPDLGMSTPYGLSGRCAAFLSELRPGHVARYAVTINRTVHLSATLCICESGRIDFTYEEPADQEVSGELELF